MANAKEAWCVGQASVLHSTASRRVTEDLESVGQKPLVWRKIAAEGLDVDYTRLLSRSLADELFRVLEDELEYYSGDLTRVFVYGKWRSIPRQQVAYGDPGMSYKFSGTSVPARPWPQVLLVLKNVLTRITGTSYNFVLVNRYRDGKDCMGEHRDDEKDLVATAPIASLSLGQARPFVFRHADARKKGAEKRNIPPVKLELEHGSLLMMNPPTNKFWYHALPPRKSCPGVRLNLTFRQLHIKPQR